MEPLTTKVNESQKKRIDELAEKYEVSRAAIMRELLRTGVEAWEHHPAQYPVDPDSTQKS